MGHKHRRIRTFLAALFVVLLTISCFADTLRLKDGSIIKGRIVSFASGKFVVIVGEGSRERRLTFSTDEVESIQFDSAAQIAGSTRGPENAEASAQPASTYKVVKTDRTATPPVPRSTPAATQPIATAPARNGSVKPVAISVNVLADNTNNGWTNTGWVVRKGQKIRIIGGGSISLGNGKTTGPSGLYDFEDPTKLLKSVPTGALIGVIGDDNNEFLYIGSERTFTAARDGALFLGVNEGNLADNSGSFEVRIEIEPA